MNRAFITFQSSVIFCNGVVQRIISVNYRIISVICQNKSISFVVKLNIVISVICFYISLNIMIYISVNIKNINYRSVRFGIHKLTYTWSITSVGILPFTWIYRALKNCINTFTFCFYGSIRAGIHFHNWFRDTPAFKFFRDFNNIYNLIIFSYCYQRIILFTICSTRRMSFV